MYCSSSQRLIRVLDLCVAAAIDAVKAKVHVPWSGHTNNSEVDRAAKPNDDSYTSKEGTSAESSRTAPAMADHHDYTRKLDLHNFTKALTEITPSASESLGTLADLRKWNDEFGEGRRDKKREQVWGKGRFGFVDKPPKSDEDGRVALNATKDRP